MEKLHETKDFIVEAAWTTHDGFSAVVVINKFAGARCGYVGIPESHSCFGLKPLELNFPPAVGAIHRGIDYVTWDDHRNWGQDPLVTQGVLTPELWWFGFSTSYPEDGILEGYTRNGTQSPDPDNPAETLAYCVVECERLAAALRGSYRSRYGNQKVYNIENRTPHNVNIYNDEGKLLIEIPPMEEPTRVATTEHDEGRIWVAAVNGKPLPKPRRVPVKWAKVEGITNLPKYNSSTLVLTSTMVREHIGTERPDVVGPGNLLRDQLGQVYGCTGIYIARDAIPNGKFHK